MAAKIKTEEPVSLNEPPDTSWEDEEATVQTAQYQTNLDDIFECKLIEIVEKNQCIYNRCHPLHKMSDYKLHIWDTIAKEISFNGPGVELEKKWRQMRDRYVRLRKSMKTQQPLRKNDKWFFYYQKMSFLDPYVEHRNRRKRGELLLNVMTSETPDLIERREDDEASNSGGEGIEGTDPLENLYASLLHQSLISSIALQNVTNSKSQLNGPKIHERGAPPIGINLQTSPVTTISPNHGPSSDPTPPKKSRRDEYDGPDDSEASLFARSVEKTLEAMSPKTFALARMEICRVMYNIQYMNATKEIKK